MNWKMVIALLLIGTPGLPAQDATPPVLATQDVGPTARIDVEHYDIELELVPENSYLRGKARIDLQVLEDTVSLPFELNNRISLIKVTDEQGTILTPAFDNFNSSRMRVRSDQAFKAGNRRQITFEFDGTLESEEYAYLDDTPRVEKAVVTPDRALLLSEGLWFPSHQLATDAATVTLKVTVPLGMTVTAPGRLDSIDTVAVSEVFNWRSDKPLNGVPVSIDRYFRQTFEEGPVPLTFFVSEESKLELAPLAEQLGRMMQYFTDTYGVLDLRELNLAEVGNVQLPRSGAWGLVLLNTEVLRPGAPSTLELARRIARQWWAYNLYINNGSDVWLQDAFATYSALRFIESETPERFPTELARLAVQALKYEERAPIIQGTQLDPGTAQYDSIINAKGAWVLYMLRQQIGAENFHGLLDDWYRQQAGKTVETPAFVQFFNQRTGEDYNWFFLQWVDSVGVPEFRVEYNIYKRADGTFRVRGQINQDIELFRMPLELRVETKGQPEEKQLALIGKNTTFDFITQTLPQKIELDPNGKILRDSEQMQVSVYVALGEEYQTQGEYVSAIREFEKAKTLNPRSSYAFYRLGETFFLQHSYSNAANSFRDALNGDLQPEWVETWTHIYLGKIYDILGQRQRALAEYTKAINSGINYNGAQDEAQKYLNEPFSKPRTLIN